MCALWQLLVGLNPWRLKMGRQLAVLAILWCCHKLYCKLQLQHGKKKKTPRSDWVAAKGHHDQRLPAAAGRWVIASCEAGAKHFNKLWSLISLSVFPRTSFPAFLRWMSISLCPYSVASQDQFLCPGYTSFLCYTCGSNSWAQLIISLPSDWDCGLSCHACWLKWLDFESLNHSLSSHLFTLLFASTYWMLCDSFLPLLVSFLSSLPSEWLQSCSTILKFRNCRMNFRDWWILSTDVA